MKVSQSCLTLRNRMDYTAHGILQARILEWVAFPFSRRSSQPRDWTQVSCNAGRFFLPAEPQGKPKNTGVGSLSLLQQIFPTQGLNPGLPHCRWILYQLSCQSTVDSGLVFLFVICLYTTLCINYYAIGNVKIQAKPQEGKNCICKCPAIKSFCP